MEISANQFSLDSLRSVPIGVIGGENFASPEHGTLTAKMLELPRLPFVSCSAHMRVPGG